MIKEGPTLGLIIPEIGLIVLFGILGWAIRFKKIYWIISGFGFRPKEEQQQLIEKGMPQKTGELLLTIAGIMLILLPLSFTSFKFTAEVQFGSMILFLMGGMVYLSRYELPNKRKQSYIISISLFVFVIGFITALTVYSYQPYELNIKKKSFEINGMYGDHWAIKEIKHVELMKKMPEITYKSNGVGLPTFAKGHFNVKDYGNCLLFIQKDSPPYIYIELNHGKIFMNAKDPEQTREWYGKLQANISH